jgi:hypothetical protein
MFGESSDEDDDNDGCSHNCRGHKNKCYKANDADGPGKILNCMIFYKYVL